MTLWRVARVQLAILASVTLWLPSVYGQNLIRDGQFTGGISATNWEVEAAAAVFEGWKTGNAWYTVANGTYQPWTTLPAPCDIVGHTKGDASDRFYAADLSTSTNTAFYRTVYSTYVTAGKVYRASFWIAPLTSLVTASSATSVGFDIGYDGAGGAVPSSWANIFVGRNSGLGCPGWQHQEGFLTATTTGWTTIRLRSATANSASVSTAAM